VEVCLMDFHEAEAVLRSGIEYCVERDIDTWRDYMRGWLAELFLRQGRCDDAADVALEVVGNDDAAPVLRYTAVTVLARLQMRRGEDSAEAFAELSRFLVKGMELQRLAAYADRVIGKKRYA
jgi:hypothetical protein